MISFSTGNTCDESKCPLSSWSYNNKILSFQCPKHGQGFDSSFRFTRSGYVLDFQELNTGNQLSIPLRYNQFADQNGLQFIGQMKNNTQIVIFNCTYNISKQYTHLCYDNDLVVGKLINNTFQESCGYGLNKSSKPPLKS